MDNNERDKKFEETINYLKSKDTHCSANYYDWNEYDVQLPYGVVEFRFNRLKSGRNYKDCCATLRFAWIDARYKLTERINIGNPTKEPSPAYVDEVVKIATAIHDKVMKPILAIPSMLADSIATAKFIK